ncbi:hypothetical protein DACRYDRAFT_23476, partial [Dacryopinax primogenitus]
LYIRAQHAIGGIVKVPALNEKADMEGIPRDWYRKEHLDVQRPTFYEVSDGGFVVLRMAYGVSADVELLAVKVESFETVYLCAAPSPAPKGIRYFAIRIMEEWDIESPQRYHFVYSDKSAKDSLDLLRATFPVRNPFKPPNMDALFLSESPSRRCRAGRGW